MQNNPTIPADLELVTDPKVTRLFPDRYKRNLPTKDDYVGFEEARMTGYDELQRLAELHERLEKEKQQPKEKCKWGTAHIKRFISRYVYFVKKRNQPDREFILEQLESIAREKSIELPSLEDIKAISTPRSKDKLISGIVSLHTENKISEYKYYYDGSNYVAYLPNENKCTEREVNAKTKWDDIFDCVYPVVKSTYSEKGKSKEETAKLRMRVESDLIRQFYDIYEYNDRTENETCPEFINRKLYNMSAAYAERKKRFRRKKDQVRWTAWWTITYDETKFKDENSFRRKLLNYFRNRSVRNKWLILGVFEHGEDNGRLHFHGFFHFPDGKPFGDLVEVERYSTKRHCMEKYIENTELREKFGINKYEDISEALRSDVNAMASYTSKMLGYMEKGEKVFYSRHIPMEFIGNFNSHDMLMFFKITCKRPMKRYVINPHLLLRTDREIRRKKEILPIRLKEVKNDNDPYEVGLLDSAA